MRLKEVGSELSYLKSSLESRRQRSSLTITQSSVAMTPLLAASSRSTVFTHSCDLLLSLLLFKPMDTNKARESRMMTSNDDEKNCCDSWEYSWQHDSLNGHRLSMIAYAVSNIIVAIGIRIAALKSALKWASKWASKWCCRGAIQGERHQSIKPDMIFCAGNRLLATGDRQQPPATSKGETY